VRLYNASGKAVNQKKKINKPSISIALFEKKMDHRVHHSMQKNQTIDCASYMTNPDYGWGDQIENNTTAILHGVQELQF
jgi:hypothetical protein